MSVAAFPITYPASIFIESQFELDRRQAAGVLGGGRDLVADRGIPQWKATLKTRPLLESEIGQWTGFRDSLRGGSRFFLGYDPRRAYPLAYMPAGWGSLNRAGGAPFDGTAGLGSIANSGLDGVGRDVVGLQALPAGLDLNAGDYLSLIQGANLLVSPLDFTNSAWGKADCTIGTGLSDPLGGTAASSMILSATGNDYVYQTVSLSPAGKTYLLTVDLKAGTLTGPVTLFLKNSDASVVFGTSKTISSSWQPFSLLANFPAGCTTGLVAFIDPANDTGTAGQTIQMFNPRLWDVSAEKISLHRVLDAAQLTADSNGALTAWIEPEVPSSFTTDAVVNLLNAAGKFRLSSFSLPVQAAGRARPGQATFTALSSGL